ncbi:MAG: hypothetical protein P9X24_01175 [Candidatus Hatepunaea meridiana]|nr:hypothetical protein [Candidatus Hatepunaea meridiana]
MGSRSSRRKSVSSVDREEAAKLLRNGAIIQNPTKKLLEAAKHLWKAGLVETRVREYVLCADPKDSDFPPKNRYCLGRIYLKDGLDESGYEYRCPDCERPVFPKCYRKRHHRELYTEVSAQGVESYISAQLTKLNENVRRIADAVYRVDLGDLGVVVCIADYCAEEKFLTRDWAATHPTCYIVVNPKGFEERFLEEEWLQRVSLADVVSGMVDLENILHEHAASGPPPSVMNVSVPVYTKGPAPIVIESQQSSVENRRFVVEAGSNVVRVEGEIVVAPQASTRYEIFRVLWDRYLHDLKQALLPERYRFISIKDLIQELESPTGKCIEDEMNIRRTINRLQTDIETTVKKKLGLPIDREDIIQTCRWKGQAEGDYGYRINPFTVAARPFQTN